MIEIPEKFLLPIPDEYTTIAKKQTHVLLNCTRIPLDRLRNHYYKGRSINATAAHYHTSPSTLKRIFQQNGIQLISPEGIKYYNRIKRQQSIELGKKFQRSTDLYQQIKYKDDNGHIKTEPYHRHVIKTKLGINLSKTDKVHHIDLDKSNNDPANLYILNGSNHATLHGQLNRVSSQLIKMGYIRFIEGCYEIDFSKLSDDSVIKIKYPPYK